jgi:lipopolysaccharide heptosyltransferase I
LPRILISRLSALGDVVCSLPAAAALKQAIPDLHLTWAVDPRFAGIVECCSFVDEVMKVKPGFKPKSWPTFTDRFDAALDLQGLLKSALVVGRAKSPLKLGYHWQREFSWLFSAAVQPDPSSIHIVDQYVDVARAAIAALGFALVDGPTDFGLVPTEEDVESTRALTGAERYVVMNAGAGWATKRWPSAYFAQVIAGLELPTMLIGGKAEADRAAADEVFLECDKIRATRPTDLLGKTSVRQLVALVAGCSAHLGGDTGSSHLAAALGRPAIGLYSITRPERSCPYGQRDRCHYATTGLADVLPDPVLATLKEALT